MRILLSLYLLSLVMPCIGHDYFDSLPQIKSAQVKWVMQYPSNTGHRKKHNISFDEVMARIAGAGRSEDILLVKPISILASDTNDLWVADNARNVLIKVTGNKWDVPKAFNRQQSLCRSLVGMCNLPSGQILFSDSRLNKLFLLKRSGKEIGTFNDSLILSQPTGIAFNAVSSEIWVVETSAHRISVIDINGNRVKTIGVRGNGPSEFNYPTSITIDKDGMAYVVDALNYRVQLFDKNGKFLSMFGEAGNSSGYFALPKGVATDSYGNIYVTDGLFHNVQIFDKQGRFLYSFGKQGRGEGDFWIPSGIFIDALNTIYVADSYNSRVQIFKLTNVTVTYEK